MGNNNSTLSDQLIQVELISKQFNELINIDNFCNCAAYPLQPLINLRLDVITIRDRLNQLVIQEICTGYSDYFDVLNTAKINADVVIALTEILIQTNPCCNSNEICNALNIVRRINTELCLLVANLVFLTHVKGENCK